MPPIPVIELFLNSEREEQLRLARTEALLSHLEALPGYTELDRLIWPDTVMDYFLYLYHTRDLNKRMMNSPEQYVRLTAMRATALTEFARLKKSLITKIQELSIKNEGPAGLEALAALSAEDFEA